MHALLFAIPLSLAAPTDYASLKAAVEAQRASFQERYEKADSAQRVSLVQEARTYLFDRITLDILPSWYGTPWDFNGTTRIPGQGTIACGYFVNTVLQDAGFRLPRVRWSQQAAEPITLKLTSSVQRFRGRPVGDVETHVLANGDGLYKVGLDTHVGFIVVRHGVARFVHSNYYHGGIGVMSEPLAGDNPLAHSRYRIVGRLLDDALMEDWITGRDLDLPRPK